MRFVIVFALLMGAIGCQAPPARPAIVPLPEDSAPQPFVDLVGRARSQAMTALEAYYVDHWAEVEDAARGLEQTARFLRKSTDVPAARQADLGPRADSLADLARQLRDAAKLKTSDRVNTTLQRINALVRELR